MGGMVFSAANGSTTMHIGLIVETDDPERLWNGFRFGTTALEADHAVEVFLLGDGVTASEVETEKFNPRGVLVQFIRDGGKLHACGTCLDSRDLAADELRPRSSMDDLLRMVERSDETITIG